MYVLPQQHTVLVIPQSITRSLVLYIVLYCIQHRCDPAAQFWSGRLLVLKFVKPRLLHIFECKVLEVKAAPCIKQHKHSTVRVCI